MLCGFQAGHERVGRQYSRTNIKRIFEGIEEGKLARGVIPPVLSVQQPMFEVLQSLQQIEVRPGGDRGKYLGLVRCLSVVPESCCNSDRVVSVRTAVHLMGAASSRRHLNSHCYFNYDCRS